MGCFCARGESRYQTHLGCVPCFFFQAEDGIRVVAVTGVQTCALPISVRVGVAGATGYSGVELLRLLSRHPAAEIVAAMGAPGAEPRYVPALRRVWDAPVQDRKSVV